jgi:chorismate mutase
MSTDTRLYAVRGAVCCTNTPESISKMVPSLYREILERNKISEDDIVSILFTVTDDLTILNPATALRRAGLALAVPLFASAEPFIEGYLPSVVRVLVTYYGTSRPEHIYMNGAEILRPDIVRKHAGNGGN